MTRTCVRITMSSVLTYEIKHFYFRNLEHFYENFNLQKFPAIQYTCTYVCSMITRLTFELFCSTGTGNFGLGMLVSHSLKSRCTLSPSICSMSLSSVGIQEGERWQFWKKTQRPRSIASCSILSARGPYSSGETDNIQ